MIEEMRRGSYKVTNENDRRQGSDRSCGRHEDGDDDDEARNKRIILHSAPSNLNGAQMTSNEIDEHTRTALIPANKRRKRRLLEIKKKSMSFIINCDDDFRYDHHCNRRECSRSFCHERRQTKPASWPSEKSVTRYTPHTPSTYDHHHHHHHCRRCQLAETEIHYGHHRRRRSLAGPISLTGTLLALLAMSCLSLFSSPSSSLAVSISDSSTTTTMMRTNNNDTDKLLSSSDATIDEDFYSATTALSQQQQQPQQQPQIPSSVTIQSASNKSGTTTTTTTTTNNNNNNSAAQSQIPGSPPKSRAATVKRAARQPGSLAISEFELMPFSEFIIQPPTFGDLMKSWPPTTLRAAASSLASAADRLTNRRKNQQQQQQRQRQEQTINGDQNGPATSLNYPKKHQQQQQQQRDHGGQQDLRSLLMGNHLNEDLDDTIVTADQSFEREQTPEPETWINYLGDLGDYIYLQLKHYLEKAPTSSSSSSSSSTRQASGTNKSLNNNNKEDPSDSSATVAGQRQQQHQIRSPQLKLETIDELLDDYYYDQYENSQVLYYGAQLVREQESFEIGCFLPIDQQAEWTKSGRPLPPDGQGSPRTITRSLFLNAKQNFTLKVFTASLSDSGSYRCSKMSRKFHKLIVVPYGASPTQVHAIQQRLLSVVSPAKQSSANSRIYQFKRTLRGSLVGVAAAARMSPVSNQLVPGYLIVEHEPLVVNCNISDIFVLQRLKNNPQFRIAWYKNGKHLPGSKIVPANLQTGVVMPSAAAANHQYSQRAGSTATTTTAHQPRIQFLDSNGRKLFISSAQYSDAGEYLCSWSNLPARQMLAPETAEDENSELLATNGNNNINRLVAPAPAAAELSAISNDQLEAISRNPLAAGSLSQLIAPVKLRPFKSTYHVRRGNQLRLVCQLQRGYPQAQLNWYVGNRLVDADFLKEHPAGRYKVLYLQNQNQVSQLVSSGGSSSSSSSSSVATTEQPAAAAAEESGADGQSDSGRTKTIVEINPIPIGKLAAQMQQLSGQQDGKWVEYRELDDEKWSIDTSGQQLRYMQQKFARLTGINISSGSGGNSNQPPRGLDADTLATLGQMSISLLVIDSLDIERDTMRYACRATNRANTDEVTTVIRVQAWPR